ncbi:TolC family protein [Enterobacter hormaechei]|uniref:TolC family protein n=1 Tax=Enterobacter hormaechei TaxID=158836 RepID=UPI000791ACD4|nr:TolC family protein [Enterobacter hormaechei]MBS6132113.1 TolC family protein [Enterobacter cloacae]MBT1810544.1 TolC family protein [Enterobacter hormaechei subsp. xiangfangensis]HCR1994085.1 TolC family protein [Enterobacter hormaechei subsp. steigerwaltii]MBW4183279.1 TolC family protein [Enterobacter hormaechei]MCE1410966.1 TolC family protein [Enterobacter hormaechei]
MKYAGIFLLMFIMVSMKSYAATKDYYSYLTMVLGNAESVKSKEALVNAEEVNKLSSQLYAVPKMSASVTPKTSKSNNNKQFVESKVTLSSLLFEDTIFNNIKAQNYKLLASVVELDKEKERITTAIMSDQIHISLYEKLRDNAVQLKLEAESLYEKINVKYDFGIIKESDVQLAKLLVQKINNEIDSIEHAIDRLKVNIESNSLHPYPTEGIKIENSKIDALLKFNNKESALVNNLDLRKLSLNKDESKENARKQDSMLSVSLVAENKWNDDETVKDDSYIGLKISLNVFDLDSKLAKSAGMKNYESLSWDYDHKYKLLQNQTKLAKLTSEANIREITNLERQYKTTKELIKNQEREYGINQASVYEMLNTRFDLFQLEKSITEMKVSEAKNKINLLQAYGQVLDFFMGET